MQAAADRASIKSVQVKGPSSGWTDLSNIWGAEWETGQQPSSYPMDISITQDDNQQVVPQSSVLDQNTDRHEARQDDVIIFVQNC